MSITIRNMKPTDRLSVAVLIHQSTNAWYEAHARPAIFTGAPEDAALFYDVYDALPGSAGVVAVDDKDGALVGSCFYHVRPTHVSLGIMNVSPAHFGKGAARRLLTHITDLADKETKPVRLVSSAMNLDSFSLYTRAGFTPTGAYQDMFVPASPNGLEVEKASAHVVRAATLDDLSAIAALEMQVSGIDRQSDWRHFIVNEEGFWRVIVAQNHKGRIVGVLGSSGHPCSHMIGPGAAIDQPTGFDLLIAQLNHYPGKAPVFLAPVDCAELVQRLYALGARNCELHFSQCRGPFQPYAGVHFPTFMPETG